MRERGDGSSAPLIDTDAVAVLFVRLSELEKMVEQQRLELQQIKWKLQTTEKPDRPEVPNAFVAPREVVRILDPRGIRLSTSGLARMRRKGTLRQGVHWIASGRRTLLNPYRIKVLFEDQEERGDPAWRRSDGGSGSGLERGDEAPE